MKLFKQRIHNFGAAAHVWLHCTEVFTSTIMLQCKQQQNKLEGIATDCSAGKQNDPKQPKTNPSPTFQKRNIKYLPETTAKCANSNINLLNSILTIRAQEHYCEYLCLTSEIG